MRRSFALLAAGAVAFAAVVVLGCGEIKDKPGSGATGSVFKAGAPPTGGEPAATDRPAGRVVYDNQGCGRCHALGGQATASAGAGGGWGIKGPDLGRVGASHDKKWITDHIRDAKAHKPTSRMPPYPEDKLSAKDLDALGEYLAGLK